MSSCVTCRVDFEILPEDQAFYTKINVPQPKRCPDCRMRLLLSFRNERVIYGRNCDMCKKFFISIYHPESPYTVYCKDCFFSDAWDQYATGRDYDAEKSFFEQFRALDLEAPKMGTVGLNTENCDYTNYFGDSRNCYLTFAGTLNEDCLYGSGINNSKNALDSLGIKKNEWTYENVNSAQCHQAKYLELCFQCSESAFLFDCRSCQNCFMCTNLRQKKYHIHNQAYSPEEYKSKMQAIDFGSYETIEMLKKEFEILLSKMRCDGKEYYFSFFS